MLFQNDPLFVSLKGASNTLFVWVSNIFWWVLKMIKSVYCMFGSVAIVLIQLVTIWEYLCRSTAVITLCVGHAVVRIRVSVQCCDTIWAEAHKAVVTHHTPDVSHAHKLIHTHTEYHDLQRSNPDSFVLTIRTIKLYCCVNTQPIFLKVDYQTRYWYLSL